MSSFEREVLTIEVSAEDSGERADVFIARSTGLSRNAASRMLEDGDVSLGGVVLKKNYRVTGGESLLVTLRGVREPETVPENIPLDVVYEDGDVIVVDKARGMVVHPAPGHSGGTLVNALLYHCGSDLSGIGGERRPGIVHRLDKDTSGLIIAAKNDFAHAKLAAQLSDRSLSRIYEAVLIGNPREDSGTVDAPIGRHPRDRKRMAVTEKNSRNAVTHYEVLARYRGYSHVRCRLETGRTHQIRVHMAHIGHPVLGDSVYGRSKNEFGLNGQCLHAARIRFVHPRSGESVELSADLPAYFRDVLRKLTAIL